MILSFADMSPDMRYQWMTQAVMPRPIAWVLTENTGGDYNLAPFSYFNAFASAPPLVGVSFTAKPGGGEKDTLTNMRRCLFFVVHIASLEQLSVLNDSSATLPYGESEVSSLGIATVPFADDFPLPRLQAAKVAFACRRYRIIPLGAAHHLALGEVRYLYADDDVISADSKGRQRIDAEKVAPIARLSAGQYAGLSDIIQLKRPA